MPRFASYGYYAEVVGYMWDGDISCPHCTAKRFGPQVYTRGIKVLNKGEYGETRVPRDSFTVLMGSGITQDQQHIFSVIVSNQDDNEAEYICYYCCDCNKPLLKGKEYEEKRKKVDAYLVEHEDKTPQDAYRDLDLW